MALFNYASKEITIKIVYYGPGLSGKTTNLQYLHSMFDPSKRGKLISLATEADRTLFFDFLPVEFGKINDFSIRFQLYTVPGQVRYNATRKLVLKGADAVVFVADSQREMREQNLESIRNMRENLIANNIDPDEIPVLLQFNKRDLANAASVDELNSDLNERGAYEFKEAVAINGTGVEETFQRITQLVMKGIAEKHKISIQPQEEVVHAAIEESPGSDRIGVDNASFASGSMHAPTIDIAKSAHQLQSDKASFQTSVHEQSIQDRQLGQQRARDLSAVAIEKMEQIIGNIQDLTRFYKDLKNVLHAIQTDMKELKKEQKELNTRLKDISLTMNNIKTKKRWFTFL